MKYLYCLLLLSLMMNLGGQSLLQPKPSSEGPTLQIPGAKSKSLNGPETIIWSEDFSNGIPSTWTQQGSLPQALWEYRGPNTSPSNSSGSRGNFSGVNNNPPTNDPLASSSTANGFIIFDSEYLDNSGTSNFGSGIAPAPHIGRLFTDTIDLSNHPSVSISLQSYVRRFFAEFYIALSTDAGQSFPDTIELFPATSIPVNASSSNAVNSTFNLTNYIGGHDSVQMQFIFDGTGGNTNGNGYYFWMIDDIVLQSTSNYSLKISPAANQDEQDLIFNPSLSNYPKYGTLHANQIVPIAGNISVVNDGAATQTNVSLAIEVRDRNSGALVHTLNSQIGCGTLNPGDTCYTSDLITNTWTPPSQEAEYDLYYIVSSDSMQGTDALTSSEVYELNISEERYSLSSGAVDNFVGTNSSNPDLIAMGSLFSLENEDPDSVGLGKVYINGVDMNLSNLSDSTADIEFAIYDTAGFVINSGFPPGTTPLFSKIFTLNSSRVGAETFYSFETITANNDTIPIALNTGSYFLVVSFFPNAFNGVIRVANQANLDQKRFSSIMQIGSGDWFSGFSSRMFESPHIGLRMKRLGSPCPVLRDTLQLGNCNGQSIISPSGNYTYNQSGLYHDTLVASNGCDSILSIYVQIGNSTTSNLNVSICDSNSYLSPAGNTYTSSGIYQDTLAGQAGCDSVLVIDLNFANSYIASDTLNIDTCTRNYRSPSGKLISQSGFYLDTLQTSLSCDSIINLNVQLRSINVDVTTVFGGTGIVANQANANYQWLQCNGGSYSAIPGETNQLFFPANNGEYAVEVNYDSCTDTSDCTLIQDISIINIPSPSIKLYPNPNTGQFKIDWDGQAETAEVQVLSLSGQQLYQVSYQKQQALDLELASGNYLIIIKIEAYEAMHRMIQVQNP